MADNKKLTPKQELFCQLYAKPGEYFGNGTQAYAEAYGLDLDVRGMYGLARSGAYDNLTKPHLLARIRELMELGPLNNETVDRELAFVLQQNADLGAKMRAISEFNKLKKRVTDKLELAGAEGQAPVQLVVIRSADEKKHRVQEPKQDGKGRQVTL